MPRYEIKQGSARGEVVAPAFASAVARAAQIGFKDPDSIVLMEDREAARAKAMRAYANYSDRQARDDERRALGGEN